MDTVLTSTDCLEYFTDGQLYLRIINGTKYWYRNGQRHRDNGPAIEWADGAKYWYKNGLLHRENGPAVEYIDGVKRWYYNGKLLCPTCEQT